MLWQHVDNPAHQSICVLVCAPQSWDSPIGGGFGGSKHNLKGSALPADPSKCVGGNVDNLLCCEEWRVGEVGAPRTIVCLTGGFGKSACMFGPRIERNWSQTESEGNEISLAKGPPQLFVYTGRLWRGSYERLIKFPKWRKASRMKATRMYKRRERRRAKRETTNGGMILNGEHVLTMRLVVVFVFSAPRPLVWDITF